MRSRRGARLVLLLAAAASTTGCFATRSDVLVLQGDISTVRADIARSDSLQTAQMQSVIAALTAATDSLRRVSTTVARMQGDAQDRFYGMEQQLLQIQELTGQSQRRLQELRAEIEQRNRAPVPAPAQSPAPTSPPLQTQPLPTGAAVAPPSAQPVVAAPSGTPGPNQLFQLALDQLRRGSTAAARAGFQDLLRQYPTSDVAADAQFYIAESFATERNASSADSVYALVVERYPTAQRAPTALYKRAVAFEVTGRKEQARAALNDVIQRYPRSDEAVLARERLRIMK